ncbi:ectoine synthase [Jejubacter calystegiae]|uniref:L-ectoine synthase n=1 Tax=Jejubacter calystegiae TaxID=2579935 RepID=A0A4P8YKS1_9ENTR|nr:ectoine synthase [Jejubacter calystegiae]QCT20284.1 ectoine synthase [Jejubacter calystegiae]
MIIRSLDDIINTERDVSWGAGKSRRLLLEKDGLGYSIMETIVESGSQSVLEYTNHLETCYCIEGEGWVKDLATGERHEIYPGVMYSLNNHDKHILAATTRLKLLSVFMPALIGPESHNLREDGGSSSY